MRWFTGKYFPQDSLVGPIDGDMILETLLKDNPTQIRKYPEEFLVLIGLSRMWYALAARPVFYDDDKHEINLQDFIKVSNPFDVVCVEKKLSINARPLLEQTMDEITQPLNAIVSMDVVPLNQAPTVDVVSLSDTKKRSPPPSSTLAYSKKLKGVDSFGSGVTLADFLVHNVLF
ncbi:hypothetical protein Tco_0651689 [Tanacetum coccineum]|uniref:Uncharacterized protein n=1 Tax=Tanacetum coccineum TaxID=301880 RepID=A0ABQ4WVJ1_9ASTR